VSLVDLSNDLSCLDQRRRPPRLPFPLHNGSVATPTTHLVRYCRPRHAPLPSLDVQRLSNTYSRLYCHIHLVTNNGTVTNQSLCSRRECGLGLFILAITGDKFVRCDPGLEVRIRVRRAIRRLLPVRSCARADRRTRHVDKLPADRRYLAMSGSSPVTVRTSDRPVRRSRTRP
jgi:hypothetical protein